MYTEILKIIEGGLVKDVRKVNSYSKLLAEKLSKDGDIKFSEMINKIVSQNGQPSTITMDELFTTPFDNESKISIVDVESPSIEKELVVLEPLLQNKITDFVSAVKRQNELIRHGIETSNTLLLYGKPGSGKTTIARHISEQTGLPLVVARFDAIVSSLLGNTAKNIRKIFEFANNKPCILFLDEFDAIAKARDDQHELGELKRVINSLLQNMDAFSSNNILIAATNHPELLDKAIWRRFNHVIEVGMPKESEVIELVKGFTNGFKNDYFDDRKKLDRLIKLFNGMSPSEIKTIINNAKTQSIIHGNGVLAFEDLLFEIYEFKNHGVISFDKMIEFLNENGMSQMDIADKMKVSLRQIRNYLNKEA
jgi:SpoVK/Ycf46/Vps4 family AAA+-type ATPase